MSIYLSEIPDSYILEKKFLKNKVIILLNWDILPYKNIIYKYNNVLMFDLDGNLKWIVSGAKETQYWDSTMDTFTGIHDYPDGTVLNSFYCNTFDLDMETGHVTFREMSK